MLSIPFVLFKLPTLLTDTTAILHNVCVFGIERVSALTMRLGGIVMRLNWVCLTKFTPNGIFSISRTLTASSVAIFANVNIASNQRVPIAANVVLTIVRQCVVFAASRFQVLMVAALRNLAFVMDVVPRRNITHKQPVSGSVRRGRVSAHRKDAIPSLAHPSFPKPALGSLARFNVVGPFKFAYKSLVNVLRWSSCSHGTKPTRALKVNSAHEWPQSGHGLEKSLFSCFWRLAQSRGLIMVNCA